MPPKAPKNSSVGSITPTNLGLTSEDDQPLLSLDRFETLTTRITRTLTDTFNNCVDKLIAGLDQKLNLRIDVQSTELFELNKRVDKIEQENKQLKEENISLKDSIKTLMCQLDKSVVLNDDLDQYSRNDNLLIHGVPLPADNSAETNLEDVIADIVKSNFPNVVMNKSDISVAHRVGSSQNPTAGARAKPPPVIVRFSRRVVRNEILHSRKLLKGKNLAITEHLTPRRAELLKKASLLATDGRIDSAWSRDGRIIVKSLQSRIIPIFKDLDLIQFP